MAYYSILPISMVSKLQEVASDCRLHLSVRTAGVTAELPVVPLNINVYGDLSLV